MLFYHIFFPENHVHELFNLFHRTNRVNCSLELFRNMATGVSFEDINESQSIFLPTTYEGRQLFFLLFLTFCPYGEGEGEGQSTLIHKLLICLPPLRTMNC